MSSVTHEHHEVAPALFASNASVALDVGLGRGALVIYPDERFRGREIEISRAGETRRVHTGVHERHSQSGSILTAIFGSLPAGDYVIWEDAESQAGGATISEGQVAEIVLR